VQNESIIVEILQSNSADDDTQMLPDVQLTNPEI
jgi:hypothetical protein